MVPFALCLLLVIAKFVEKLASSVSPDACPSPAQQWHGVGNNAGIRRTGHRFPPSGPGQALKLSWLSSAGKLRQQGLPQMTTGDTCNRPSTALGFGVEDTRHANLPEPGPDQHIWLLPLGPRPKRRIR